MWFFIGFHFISFFKEIIKKFFFISSYLLFWNFFWRYDPRKIQKNRKMLKKRHYLQQQLESHFWHGKRWNLDFSIYIKIIENWISCQKNINSEWIGILSSKLWPKYETSVEDNTNSALSSIFYQNFKWGSTSNLSKPI